MGIYHIIQKITENSDMALNWQPIEIFQKHFAVFHITVTHACLPNLRQI